MRRIGAAPRGAASVAFSAYRTGDGQANSVRAIPARSGHRSAHGLGRTCGQWTGCHEDRATTGEAV